jgi:hypothetical protein
MISTVSSPLFDSPDSILCYYINQTSQIQCICFSGIEKQLFERLIFPQQRFLFEASPDAFLEISSCSGSGSGETLIKQIPCWQLKVNQKDLLHPAPLSTPFDAVSQANLVNE